DSCLLSVAVGGLEHEAPKGKTHQDCQEEMINLAKDLAAGIQKLVNGLKVPSDVPVGANGLATAVEKLTESAKNAAVTTSNQKTQSDLLRLVKDTSGSMLNLVSFSRVATATPSDTKKQQDVMTSSQGASAAISRMVTSLKSGVIAFRDLDDA